MGVWEWGGGGWWVGGNMEGEVSALSCWQAGLALYGKQYQTVNGGIGEATDEEREKEKTKRKKH